MYAMKWVLNPPTLTETRISISPGVFVRDRTKVKHGMSNQSTPPVTEDDRQLANCLLNKLLTHHIIESGNEIDLKRVSAYLYNLFMESDRLHGVIRTHFIDISNRINVAATVWH